MFDVKICGIRLPKELQAVKTSGADAIGLNFFAPSVRSIDPNSPAALELSRLASAAGLLRVGVFVNETPRGVAEIARRLELDVIQLHGDEPVGIAQEVRSATDLPVVRAVKLPPGEIRPVEIARRTDPWVQARFHLLLDADAGASHGGSGNSLHWPSVRAWAEQCPDVAWTLAGGLTAENVAEAIHTSGARSVDTASGVEESRGVKSARRIERFVAEARAALLSR